VLIPDDKGSLLPLAGERGDGEDLAGVPVDEVEALHLARVPKIVGHRLVHAQRGYSQTTCYTENQVFCFELFTVAHLFGFHPNTWIFKHLVFLIAFSRIFIHLFFLYFDIVLKFCIISYFLISTVSHAQLLSHPNIYFILPSKK
jgi:hypothetical protein